MTRQREPHPLAVVGREPLGTHQQPGGVLSTEQHREQVRAGRLGGDSQVRERASDPCVGRHHDEVGVGEQRRADAERHAVHGAQQRLGKVDELVEHAREAVRAGDETVGVGRACGHLGDVGARGERPSRPGDHDDGDVGRRGGLDERLGRGVVEGFVERVQRVRTVQRDDPDPTVVLDAQHDGLSARSRRAAASRRTRGRPP